MYGSMQLYYTESLIVSEGAVIVEDERILHQVKRVMRSRIGDSLMIQTLCGGMMMRYECVIQSLQPQLVCTIIREESYSSPTHRRVLVIGMGNKRDKMELIVQKVTECGVTDIIIVPMSRSLLRHCNDHKRHRLQTIILEASEQARLSYVPTLQWFGGLSDVSYEGDVYIADFDGNSLYQYPTTEGSMTMVIGPEGGFDSKDRELISQKSGYTCISLGSTVLRMETAAIVSSWWMNIQR